MNKFAALIAQQLRLGADRVKAWVLSGKLLVLKCWGEMAALAHRGSSKPASGPGQPVSPVPEPQPTPIEQVAPPGLFPIQQVPAPVPEPAPEKPAMKKLAEMRDASLLTKGLFPSLPDNQAQLWKIGDGIDFYPTGVGTGIGLQNIRENFGKITTPGNALEQALLQDGTKMVYIGTSDHLFTWTAGDFVQIGAGFTASRWSFVTWGDWLIATNNVQAPQVWKNNGTPIAALTGVRRPTFKLVKRDHNRILGYFGQSIDWSSDSNPELWLPADDNSAGGQLIRDLDSDINAVCPISSTTMGVYSLNTMVLQTYLGAPYFYGFGTRIEGIGAWSDCVVQVGNRNYGWGPNGFWQTDGIGYQYIDTPQIKNLMMGDNFHTGMLDRSRTNEIHALHDVKNSLIRWFYMQDGEDEGRFRSISYNYKQDSWTLGGVVMSAAAPKEIFDYPLAMSYGSLNYVTGYSLGGAAGSDGHPLFCTLTSFPFDGNIRDRRKLWDALELSIEHNGTTTSLEVRFGFSDTADGAVDWTDWTLAVNGYNYINRESAYLHLDFRTSVYTIPDGYWLITGMAIWGEVTGYEN